MAALLCKVSSWRRRSSRKRGRSRGRSKRRRARAGLDWTTLRLHLFQPAWLIEEEQEHGQQQKQKQKQQ